MLRGVACDIATGVRLLRRLGLDDIVTLAKDEWGIGNLPIAKGKKKVIEILLAHRQFRSGLTYLHLAQVDLRYNQLHSVKRKWRVYRLVPSGRESTNENELQNLSISDVKAFEGKISAELIYFHHHVCVQLYGGRFWIRIGIEEGINNQEIEGESHKQNAANAIYFVLHPASSTVFSSAMKKEHKAYLLHTLVTAFGHYDLVECDLTGRNLQALTELALYQHSQGPYRSYRMKNGLEDGKRENGEDDTSNPLRSHRKKKRMFEGKSDEDESSPSTKEAGEHTIKKRKMLRKEATVQQREVRDDLRRNFGSHEQPALDAVEFRVVDSFRGGNDEEGPSDFECVVKFEGPNVLEGIKQMLRYGIAEAPLPPHLATIHSAAKNSFSLGGDAL